MKDFLKEFNKHGPQPLISSDEKKALWQMFGICATACVLVGAIVDVANKNRATQIAEAPIVDVLMASDDAPKNSL